MRVLRAGTRTVRIPATIVAELREHITADSSGSDPAALVFTGPLGGVPRRGNFRRDSERAGATRKLGGPCTFMIFDR